ncbi:hypothetical protein SUGI_0767930 [Cryptomeria japonica]|nr:hypothetical protein SUGI_0767930 [Cryptomeria japonica]
MVSHGRGNAEKAQALFVFGESYADTGNHDRYNQSADILLEKSRQIFWGDSLVLPAPTAYELLKSHDCKSNAKKIRQGVNFAVEGSGIFEDYGFKTIAQQFLSLRLLTTTVHSSLAETDPLRTERSGETCSKRDNRRCERTIGKTSCDSNYDEILALHIELLKGAIEILKSDLKELSIIISDLVSAINHIFSSPAQFGFVDLFGPCCAAKGRVDMCGEVDQVGRALFEVCSNVDEKFFWDSGHPAQRGCHAIMWLYSNGAKGENCSISFIEGAPNVIEWVESLGFVAYNI